MDTAIKFRRKKLKETLVWLRDTPELPGGDKFDIRNWGRVDVCGSVHCIAGWYVKRNPALGLSFVQKGDSTTLAFRRFLTHDIGVCWIRKTEDENWTWDTDETDLFAEHFGLSKELAEALFYPAGDREPDDRVAYAERALELLEQHELFYESPDDRELRFSEAEKLLSNSELTLSVNRGTVWVSFDSKIAVRTFGRLRELLPALKVLGIQPVFGTDDE